MKVLMLDLDTLRPDHMGCYGYFRNTTPVLDGIAAEGARFTHYHCSDAPCLPSRAALCSGRFGYHNGAVGHGGLPGDMRLTGIDRGFQDQRDTNNFFNLFRKAGMFTASISPFAERHSSYWFTAGFNEVYNTGRCGGESAEEILPVALDWVKRNAASRENWFLHINFWDAHTPYRAPAEFGNPFENEPIPDWITDEILAQHNHLTGPHGSMEIGMYTDRENPALPRHPGKVTDRAGLHRFFDGYDCGVRYMDTMIGKLLDALREEGVYDDLAIIVTADHGENLGELGMYAEHGTADEITTRIPMLIKWPGVKPGTVLEGFHYNLDIVPTMADLLNLPHYEKWDGESYANALLTGEDQGRDYLVVSQCAHVCQRSVRFGDYLYMRTYHDGYHLWKNEMLFDLKNDPHEQFDIAEENPALCGQACRYLVDWEHQMRLTADTDIDPLVTVLREGGPFHAKDGNLPEYCRRLEQTGRKDGADALRKKYPQFF